MPIVNKMRILFAALIIALSLATTVVADDSLPVSSKSAAQMAQAARSFIDLLDAEQRKATLFSLGDAGRTTWSNLPIIMVEPGGTLLLNMTDPQRMAVHDMLRAALSTQGYAKMTGVMYLEDLLYEIEVEELSKAPATEENASRRVFIKTRKSGNYAVAIFGNPGDKQWGWKIAGHHAAMNFTVADGRVGFTPTFLGSAPMVVQSGHHAGWSVLPHEGDRGVEMMRALTPAQQKTALINPAVASDVFEGPGRKASLSNYEGISTGDFSAQQMKLLQVLVAEYLRNADFDTAEAHFDVIANIGWDKLWFSWQGAVDPDGRFYYRVHGPRLLIEYNRQDANHDHMIVRDPKNDYGEDWLEKHYEEHHPTMEEAMKNARQRIESAMTP